MTARRMLTKLARDLAQGLEPKAVSSADQYGVRGIAKLSPIADFDEFMRIHEQSMKAVEQP